MLRPGVARPAHGLKSLVTKWLWGGDITTYCSAGRQWLRFFTIFHRPPNSRDLPETRPTLPLRWKCKCIKALSLSLLCLWVLRIIVNIMYICMYVYIYIDIDIHITKETIWMYWLRYHLQDMFCDDLTKAWATLCGQGGLDRSDWIGCFGVVLIQMNFQKSTRND